jgi:hypothetical protein
MSNEPVPSNPHSAIGQTAEALDPSRSSARIAAGSEQGQASVALGAVFTLNAMPTVHMIHVLWSSSFHGFGRLAEGAAAVVGFLVGLFVLGSLVVGFAFGIMGITAAKRQGRTIALALAGTLLNFFAFWGWLGIVICWTIAVAGRP